MDGFHTFNTGNLKKFLQQTKKNKEPLFYKSVGLYNQKYVVKIQKNIRALLTLNNNLMKQWGILWVSDRVQNYNSYELCNCLQGLKNGNIVLFNRVHRMTILSLYEQNKKQKISQNFKSMIQFLGTLANRIHYIFNILTYQQKQFWVCHVLKCCQDFTFKILTTKQMLQMVKILTKKYSTFISTIVVFPNKCDFIEQVINIICQNIQIKQPQLQQTQLLTNLPLNIAYQNIMTVLSNHKINQFGNNLIYILNTLKIIINILCSQCQFAIIEAYKIDYKYLKVQGQLFQQIIQQKPQWNNFMEFLNLSNKFNLSVLKWVLMLQKQQQFLKTSGYISDILKLIPLYIPLDISNKELANCFIRLSQWIKVHEICINTDQQRILYPLLMLIYRKIYRMTDKQFIQMIKNEQQMFIKILKDKLIKIIYKIILIIKSNQFIQIITKVCIDLLEEIYNRIFRTNVITTQIFVNQIMTEKLIVASNNDYQIHQFIKKFPFVFSLKTRIKKFKQCIHSDDDYYQLYNDSQYPMPIRRGHQFEDLFTQIKNRNLKKLLNVTFINQFGLVQKGADGGGLTKQLINRVLKDAFKREFEMFFQNSEKQLLPHPQKVKQQGTIWTQYYQFIGKMIGKALYEGITIGPKFCGPFLNAIIGKKNNFDDLKKIDKQLYKSLTYIKTMQQDAEQLSLTFQYKDQWLNKLIDLKKNGQNIRVTNQNKQEYISLIANYKVNRLLQFQSRHIRKGLKSVINSDLIFMFNYEELSYLISGSGQIKLYQLKRFTQYNGYTENSMTVRMFWKVVEEFDDQAKSNLLLFVTACPRPSFLGFQDLKPPFTIIKTANVNLLPISHTCSNMLQLPDYQDIQTLESKLKMAISSCAGFQII